jgi:hypothetical protein
MIKKVYRDANGLVINIGEWDDMGGAMPLPAGATFADEEVVTTADGGQGCATDYAKLRQYPSIADQLDMKYWDSVNETTNWLDTIAAIKAQVPKV